MMSFSLQHIAEILHIALPSDIGSIAVSGFSNLEFAKEGELSFFADARYEHLLYTSKASAIIVPADFSPKQDITAALIRVENPRMAINQLLLAYQKILNSPRQDREDPHFIHPSASIGQSVYIGAFSYIGANATIADEVQISPQVFIGKNVTIGKGTTIGSGAKIMDNTIIGDNVEIDMCAVIGSKGFGYVKQADGTYVETPQIGSVLIEDKVYIGACTTIDRAMMGKTIIQKGTKIDNQVQIGHNVGVGENTILCAQVGIAGSTKMGNGVILAGKVGVADHLTIAEGVAVLAMSGVNTSVKEPNIMVSGLPASPYREDRKQMIMVRKLPDYINKIEELEKRLAQLENRTS